MPLVVVARGSSGDDENELQFPFLSSTPSPPPPLPPTPDQVDDFWGQRFYDHPPSPPPPPSPPRRTTRRHFQRGRKEGRREGGGVRQKTVGEELSQQLGLQICQNGGCHFLGGMGGGALLYTMTFCANPIRPLLSQTSKQILIDGDNFLGGPNCAHKKWPKPALRQNAKRHRSIQGKGTGREQLTH